MKKQKGTVIFSKCSHPQRPDYQAPRSQAGSGLNPGPALEGSRGSGQGKPESAHLPPPVPVQRKLRVYCYSSISWTFLLIVAVIRSFLERYFPCWHGCHFGRRAAGKFVFCQAAAVCCGHFRVTAETPSRSVHYKRVVFGYTVVSKSERSWRSSSTTSYSASFGHWFARIGSSCQSIRLYAFSHFCRVYPCLNYSPSSTSCVVLHFR